MVPTPLNLRTRSPGFLYPVASLVAHHVPKLVSRVFAGGDPADLAVNVHTYAKREEKHDAKFIVFACLIPILVLLSGLFAGLTLGYMSLDETQLHVLSISGTPKQKEYARKIEPIRKNGHLLLVTLLLANMIVNETLPVISDPILGGGVQSVVVSTVLIVIFSEIIPQSLCTRYGLAIGAEMAWLVRILIIVLGVVSWPVAKLLEFVLGPHHGIMYRRGELKELIAMHATNGQLGGDLKADTVTIIGATLDLQEKVAKQAMTPIDKVFMLDIESKLDIDTMRKIYNTGHSRIPVYEEVDVPIVVDSETSLGEKGPSAKVIKEKKIVGILLVKQCLMLDPKDATPLKTLPLQRINMVPNNTPLLQILDKFQEGRSHMAIVTRISETKAESIKQQVKKGLTQRLKERVGISDSSGSESESDSDSDSDAEGTEVNGEGSTAGSARGSSKKGWKKSFKRRRSQGDVEKGEKKSKKEHAEKEKEPGTPQSTWQKLTAPGREQSMPDDAVLPKDNAKDFLEGFDPAVSPLGIITLEDVLEELIGEEIYDEFDAEGESHLQSYVAQPKHMKRRGSRGRQGHAVDASPVAPSEGTAVAAESESDAKTRKAHSQPTSPNLTATHEDGPISRTSSFGNHIGVLAQIRKATRQGADGSPPPARTGWRTPRERSQQRKSRSEGEMANVGLAPLSGAPERISEYTEEPQEADDDVLRIPNTHEKRGPDKATKDE